MPSEMGRILGLDGMPINNDEPVEEVEAAPLPEVYAKRTKRELEINRMAVDKLAELAEQCIKIMFNEELSMEERQAKADEKTKEWLKFCGGCNHELIRLNAAHAGFEKGRKPRLFTPQALDRAVEIALEHDESD